MIKILRYIIVLLNITMGIYSNGRIYGIRWNISDKGSLIDKKKFEKIYEEPMNIIQIQEIKEQYYQLTLDEIQNARFSYFTLCSMTYKNDTGTFMSWLPFSKIQLEELFVKLQ